MLSQSLISHECQKTQIQINEETQKKLDAINNAENKDDLDSLLRELYGFESAD
jgi:plasmid maintenance system killer protein